MMNKSKRIALITIICILSSHGARGEEPLPAPDKKLRLFSYDELKTLSKVNLPADHLQKRLDTFFRSCAVSNKAFRNNDRPFRPFNSKIGVPVIRLTNWNIEKSLNLDNAIKAFTSPAWIRGNLKPGVVSRNRLLFSSIMRQQHKLASSDIVVLQEMELGIKRSGYRHAARELARALDMNYAYAPQYLEIDPVRLGLESIYCTEGELDTAAMDYYRVDPERYKGVFGSAVISRYPIIYTEVQPLRNQGYDWYAQEKQKTTFFEQTRRAGSHLIFKDRITREVKRGGRHFFRVDLHVPSLPEKRLTVINVHLEIKCSPEEREKQITEILEKIRHIHHPVILVGDFNSSHTDLSPTSASRVVKRTLKNPTTWLSAGIAYISPYSIAINTSRGISNYTKNLDDPLAPHIPVVAPNKLRSFFKKIQNFRFSDGGYFDFRGNEYRSMKGHAGILSNSNQRDLKGFKTTFSVTRPIGPVIGKYKLDWVFVKSYAHKRIMRQENYLCAPHYGETLSELNRNLIHIISDHDPITVDIPLKEPKL